MGRHGEGSSSGGVGGAGGADAGFGRGAEEYFCFVLLGWRESVLDSSLFFLPTPRAGESVRPLFSASCVREFN